MKVVTTDKNENCNSTDSLSDAFTSNSLVQSVNYDVNENTADASSKNVVHVVPNKDVIISRCNSVILEAENTLLISENKKLQMQIERLLHQRFGIQYIENDEKAIRYYTGLTKETFNIVLKLCSEAKFEYFYEWNVECFSLADQLLITLMKLRLNLEYQDLTIRFNTSNGTICNIIMTFIQLLHEIIYVCLMSEVPTQEKNALCLPNCFVSFRNCRMIIDCTEFACAVPKHLDEQKETYSSYKHKNTLKGLIGIAPNGCITYCSSLYPGSTSDKMIVKHSGILDIFKPGDLLLADKGFLLDDIVPQGVSVNIPPFLVNSQFTPAEVEKTKNIARARIHVERAIRRIKYYEILEFIPKSLFRYSTKVFQLCAGLTNFQNPLLKEVEKLYTATLYNDDDEEVQSCSIVADEISLEDDTSDE